MARECGLRKEEGVAYGDGSPVRGGDGGGDGGRRDVYVGASLTYEGAAERIDAVSESRGESGTCGKYGGGGSMM